MTTAGTAYTLITLWLGKSYKK